MTAASSEAARFADEAGEFEIHSHPVFLLTRGKETEVLVFDAVLQVRTATPENRNGKRQVDLAVTDWTAKAHSRLLDQEIVLRLEGDQPTSVVTAQKFDRDFPARLEFRMRWGVEVAGNRITDRLESTAVGQINEFPPRSNDRFEIIGKDLEVEGIRLESLVCAC
jgi:hypothetical protein